MGMQTRTDHANTSNFLPADDIISETGHTLGQISGRTEAIANLTVLAEDSADGFLYPLDDDTAYDGTQIPYGLLRGTVSAASIDAGDVANVEVYVAGKYFDESKIILEGDLTLDTRIKVDTISGGDANRTMRIRTYLRQMGIIVRYHDGVVGYENS